MLTALALAFFAGGLQGSDTSAEPAQLSAQEQLAAREAETREVSARFGEDHPDVGVALAEQAMVRHRLGASEQARPEAERALAVLGASVGLADARAQRAVQVLAGILVALKDLDAAREQLEAAAQTGRAELGPGERRALVETIKLLSEVSFYQDDFVTALAFAEEATQLAEEELGPGDGRTLIALGGVADMLEPLGEMTRARAIYEELAPRMEEVLGPAAKELGTMLHNHAYLEIRLGEYERARGLCERAVAIRSAALGDEHPATLNTLTMLGNVLRAQGDLSAARPVLERALEAGRRVLPAGHTRLASLLRNLAWVRADLGNPQEAVSLLEEALVIFEEGPGPESLLTARALTQYGAALSGLDDPPLEAACDVLERALDIMVAVLGRDDLTTAQTLVLLAGLQYDLGDPEAALALCSEGLEVFERKLGSDASPVQKARHMMGRIRLLGWGAEAAIPWFRAKLESDSSHSRDRATTQTLLGGLLLDVGREDEALRLMVEGFREAWTSLVLHAGGLTEEELFAWLATQRNQLSHVLELPRRIARPDARQHAYEAQLAWKGLVARLVQGDRARSRGASSPERERDLAELADVQRRLSNLCLGEDETAGDRERARAPLEARRRELARELEAPGAGSVSWLEWTELRDALPTGSAALDLIVTEPLLDPKHVEGQPNRGLEYGEPYVVAWIVRPDAEAPVRVDLGAAAALAAATRAALDELGPAGAAVRGIPIVEPGAQAPNDALQQLSELLWAPLTPHLEGVEQLVVSPDSFLCALPFEVLVGVDGRHLIEQYAFVYAHDLAGEVRRPAGVATSADVPSLLVVGGVDFGVAAGRPAPARWQPLPGTARESESIAELHEALLGAPVPRTVLTGAEATEEALLAALPRHTLAHLATHGFFLGADLERRLAGEGRGSGSDMLPGLLNGLVCAGANAPREGASADGLLTAEELGWLDLSGVELVVLSACDTAQGVSRSGEGLIGLRRAIHGAGARHVVSSLWPVDDRATTELMEAFYARLWGDTTDVREALRGAQLELMARQQATHGESRPTTWGAFVISGDWR